VGAMEGACTWVSIGMKLGESVVSQAALREGVQRDERLCHFQTTSPGAFPGVCSLNT
jgi:hypothetical protein